MSKTISYISVVIILLFSCIRHEEKKTPLAKVYDKVLYFEDDLENIIPNQLSEEDSILFVKSYVNKWAQQQLLVEKAKINLKESELEIEELVSQYRQDLLINKYKEAVVAQELDTIITQIDIDSFYIDNKQIFKLNEELVKFRYLYFGNDILNPKEFISLFKKEDQESDAKILEQELQLKSFNLNDSIWIKYDDIVSHVPFLKKYSKNRFLRKNFQIQEEDSSGVYIVKVKDVLLRNEIAPMSYALPTIRQMILHKRKLELLRKIEETLTKDAIKNNELQIY